MNIMKHTLLTRLLNPKVCSLALCKNLLQEKSMSYTSRVMPPLEEDGKDPEKTSKWLSYNNKIFPPQLPGEERRPAYVCHMKSNIKYSPKKMWYIACFVRGMSVDEALRQLTYIPKKGAIAVKEAILEAQKLAVEEHYVEYKSNLWIAESFVGKGHVVKGIRRHARLRYGEVEYKYCHYFIRLEEGQPPLNYYNKPIFDKNTLLMDWIEKMRNRRVISSL